MRVVVFVSLFFAGCTVHGARHPVNIEKQVFMEQEIRRLLDQGTKALQEPGPEHLRAAEAAFMLARELSPRDARVLDALGCVAWAQGMDELAIYYFRQALAERPDFDRPYEHLGTVAFGRRHFRAAEELWRRALGLNPLNVSARKNLGALLSQSDLFTTREEAMRELLKASHLEIRPTLRYISPSALMGSALPELTSGTEAETP